jgi:hypothetical protein
MPLLPSKSCHFSAAVRDRGTNRESYRKDGGSLNIIGRVFFRTRMDRIPSISLIAEGQDRNFDHYEPESTLFCRFVHLLL